MSLIKKNIQVIIVLTLVLLIIIYMFANVSLSKSRWKNESLEKRYTIATIYDYENPVKNAGAFKYKFNFNQKLFSSSFLLANRISFKNKEHTNHYKIEPKLMRLSTKELQIYVGKRYYVKFIVNYPKNSELLLDKPVSDSILKAPDEGWLQLPE